MLNNYKNFKTDVLPYLNFTNINTTHKYNELLGKVITRVECGNDARVAITYVFEDNKLVAIVK